MLAGETTRQPKRYTTMLATGQTRLQTSGGAAVIGIAALVVLASTMMVRAQRGLKNIPKPDVEKELAAFRVAEGFEINLFAADPMINKPTEINFDAAGRLWVASSSLYPHIKPGEVPEDRVIVLEDEDGDGRADRSTVFADGLLMPTGVEPGDGGAYVANSTELLHLADTDGDGKADRRRVMLSGFGTEDTHHILHAFRWGHDGFLYFNQSIYIHSHVETPHGVRRLNAGGVWQFRPDTLELGVFVYGMVNGWGHAFDYWGQHFGTDGAYGEGVLYFLPGASFVTAKTEAPILRGLNRGQPKYCSNEIVDGRHLPDGWQGSFITNDFRAHRVVRFVISDDGSGYSAKRMPDVLRSSHIAFRPIDVKIGPDGAIYIADWYNPIIQHGEVSFRDPRRNHVNGRIWRLTAKGRPLVERPELVGAKVETLLDHLRAPEKWTRHFAKRVLQERPVNEVIPALDRWVIGLDPNDASHEHHLLEALWVRQCLRQPSSEHLTRLLRSSEPRVRAAAVRVVSHWLHALPDHLALLAAMVADDFARVRLEAVRALARVKDPRAVELAVSVLERPMDRFLDYALAGTVRELRGIWLPALQDGSVDFGGDSRHLEYALRAAGSPDVVGPIVELVRKGDVPQPRRAALLRVVAAVGSVDQMEFAIDEALALRESLAVDVLSAVAGSCAARGIRVHYPLLAAAGYTGLMTWHGGFSGSAPLKVTTKKDLVELLGENLAAGVDPVPTFDTILSGMNLFVSGGLLIGVPLLIAALSPSADDPELSPIDAFPAAVADEAPADEAPPTSIPERLERSRIVTALLAVPLLWAMYLYYSANGVSRLDPNIVNLTLLTVGLMLHPSPKAYLQAVADGVKGCAGIILQFPLYGGIMGVMATTGLAKMFATWAAGLGSATAYSIVTFFIAGLINFFVPSGGGQWAVQGPVAVQAASELGIPLAKAVMAVAYGDQWTNMLQPFWALPLLGITGVRARDIIGYTATIMVISGAWFILGLMIF